MTIARILVAVDGSEASMRALQHGAQLSFQLGAALDILLVRLVLVGRSATHVVLTDEDVAEIEAQARETAAAAGKSDATFLVVKSRDTAFKIVDIAIDRNADLIVMGASGRSGFKAFLLGSISQEVLKKSACPVTIVH